MKIQGNPWWNRSMGTIFPTAFVHSLPLCHSLVILTAFLTFALLLYLLWWSTVQWVHLDHCKESACQRWRCKRHRFNLWVGKIPWRKKWQPTPVFLLRKSHGQWSLVGYNPWGCKRVKTRLSDWAHMVTCDLWCYYYDSLKVQMMVSSFLAIKYF